MIARILTSVAALTLTAGAVAAEYKLTILHTNDFHARFEPISKYDSGCSAEDNDAGECVGGSARLMTAIGDAKARSNNHILVDGGDQFGVGLERFPRLLGVALVSLPWVRLPERSKCVL